MSTYIRAVAAAKAIADKYGIPLGDLVETFAEIPAADVAPVVHGRKIEDEGIGFFICAPCAADVCRMVRITAPIVGRKWTRRTDNVHIC